MEKRPMAKYVVRSKCRSRCFWRTTLRLRSAWHRQQPTQRAILSHVDCFRGSEIVTSQISFYTIDVCHYNLVTFKTADSQRRPLRSSQTRAAVMKRTRMQFSKRAFSACDPSIWNSLPPAVRNIDSHPAFRRALKSHLFYCVLLHNFTRSCCWLL